MKEFIINNNDAGQRVDRFVKKIAPDLPKSLMYKMFRKKDVLLNGKKTKENVILEENNTVSIYIHDKFLKKDMNLDFRNSSGELNIVFEDENIIVVEKPIGLLTQPSESGYQDNLVFRMWKYLFNKKEYIPSEESTFSPAFCGRLDRNTGGLLIGCKNAKSIRYFNEIMRKREIRRLYLALVEGVPKRAEGSIKSSLSKDENTLKSEISKDGDIAITKYKTLKIENFKTLIEAELVTGRFHQIRVHLSAIGNPLLGDKKYGSKMSTTLSHQALYAYKIIINTDVNNEFEKYNGIEFTSKNIPEYYKYEN